jgi:hypothetical protein
MLRRHFVISFSLLVAIAGLSAVVYAQLESAERGIAPLDTSGTLEIGGIHIDVTAADAQTARLEGWRMAQRLAFRALWAKMHNSQANQAPNISDDTLDQIVSAISVEKDQIGPNRYIADLGVQFDRTKAAQFLGVEGGQIQRSVPMLLIPVTVTAGTETSVELRNAWQAAWAKFQTSQSSIDYVRISGNGTDPLLINASQTRRPGRGWWRNLLDVYGAQDILVAEVQLQRLYPGGPARARFIGRHGPDNQVVGGFTLTAPSSEAIPAMMAEGAKRMDQLFGNALAAGSLSRDPSLNPPPPPPMPELAEKPVAKPTNTANSYQIQVTGTDVNIYNFAMAHLKTLGGVVSATPQLINPSGTSYVLVKFNGDIAHLAAALTGRGWTVEYAGTVVKLKSANGKPPPLPPSAAPAPVPTPPSPQPQSHPSAAPGQQ